MDDSVPSTSTTGVLGNDHRPRHTEAIPVITRQISSAHSVSLDSDYSDIEEDLGIDGENVIKRAEVNKLLHVYGDEVINEEDDDEEIEERHGMGTFLHFPCKAAEQAEEFVKRVWAAGWRVVHHRSLPKWLQDNDFLLTGHRQPTNSFRACFKSIFRIHTETGNIWTHLLGMIAFVGIACYFLTRPSIEIQWQEKAVFSAFFAGAILCLGFSWVFHTVYCHSETVGRFFNKLDYCGIALLTMGSFVPWLYYSFYCRLEPKITYLVLIFTLGIICIIVSLWDKFAQPQYRAVRAGLGCKLACHGPPDRIPSGPSWPAKLPQCPQVSTGHTVAGVFIGLGLSGVIPAMHYVITDGFHHAIYKASLGWLVLMAVLYILGAVIYAVRIPERLFPGKFDIWSCLKISMPFMTGLLVSTVCACSSVVIFLHLAFLYNMSPQLNKLYGFFLTSKFQSHQIFHMFVIAAAFVHYHGISEIANYRLTLGDCLDEDFAESAQ